MAILLKQIHYTYSLRRIKRLYIWCHLEQSPTGTFFLSITHHVGQYSHYNCIINFYQRAVCSQEIIELLKNGVLIFNTCPEIHTSLRVAHWGVFRFRGQRQVQTGIVLFRYVMAGPFPPFLHTASPGGHMKNTMTKSL